MTLEQKLDALLSIGEESAQTEPLFVALVKGAQALRSLDARTHSRGACTACDALAEIERALDAMAGEQ